jgi:hypothetical protein
MRDYAQYRQTFDAFIDAVAARAGRSAGRRRAVVMRSSGRPGRSHRLARRVWRVAIYRIVRRHFLLSLAGTNRHPGLTKLVRFGLGTRRYYAAEARAAHTRPLDDDDDGAITRAMTAVWLRPYGRKVTHCRTARDLTDVKTAVPGQATRAKRSGGPATMDR